MELGQLGVLRGPKCPRGPGSSGAVQWVLGFRPLEGKGRSQKLDFLSCPVHTCSHSAETHSGVEPPSPLCPVSLNPAPGCFHHVQGQDPSQGGTTWPFPAQEVLSESHGLRVKSSLFACRLHVFIISQSNRKTADCPALVYVNSLPFFLFTVAPSRIWKFRSQGSNLHLHRNPRGSSQMLNPLRHRGNPSSSLFKAPDTYWSNLQRA